MTKPIFSVVISLLKILWLRIKTINFKNLFSTIRSRSRSWRKIACDYAGRHYSMSTRFFTLLRNRPKKNNLNQLYWYDFSLMGDSLSSFCDVCVEMEVLENRKLCLCKVVSTNVGTFSPECGWNVELKGYERCRVHFAFIDHFYTFHNSNLN